MRPEWWGGLRKDEEKEISTVKEISFYFKRKKKNEFDFMSAKQREWFLWENVKNNTLQFNTYKHNNISNPTGGKNTKFSVKFPANFRKSSCDFSCLLTQKEKNMPIA